MQRYFAEHEFADGAQLLCCSDATPLTLRELLELADDESRAAWERCWLGYSESQGLPALRAEVAKHHGGGVTADDVLCCVPQEGILLAHACLQPGQHVVVTAPGYQSLHSLADALRCRVSPWLPSRAPDGTLRFDIAELQRLLKLGPTSMVVWNFPHNPTGFMPTRAEFVALVDAVRAAGAVLLSDEMYSRLSAQECPSAAELYTRAISLGGLSKSHGCAGLRCGWLVTRDAALRRQLAEAKDYTTICGSAPSEVLGLMALRASDVILARNRATCAANLALLDAFFARHAATFEWSRPTAGSVGFPRLLTGESADDFCARVLAGCNVLLLPSSVYVLGMPADEQRIRIGFGRSDMPECLRILEDFLSR